MPDEDLVIPVPGDGDGDQPQQPGGDEMPAEDRFQAAEHAMILGMGQSYAAANARRIDGADALAEFVRLGHDARRDRMNQADSFAYQVAREAGSGRTRVESNTPAATQTIGGT